MESLDLGLRAPALVGISKYEPLTEMDLKDRVRTEHKRARTLYSRAHPSCVTVRPDIVHPAFVRPRPQPTVA